MAERHTRVGWGFDAHRFRSDGAVVLLGVEVDQTRGIEATSDGDVAAHAVIDAVLGALAAGDVGDLFPSNDPEMDGADSMELLGRVLGQVGDAGYQVENIDVTVVSEAVRIAPHRQAMRGSLAKVLEVDVSAVSVKATTTDGMGSIGADEGIAAAAVVLLSLPPFGGVPA